VRAADRDVHAGVGDGPVGPAGRTAHLVYRATRDRVRPLRRDVEEAHHLERAGESAARCGLRDPAQVEADPAVVPRARAVAVTAAAAARTGTAGEVPGIRHLDADRRRVHARRRLEVLRVLHSALRRRAVRVRDERVLPAAYGVEAQRAQEVAEVDL